MPMTRQDEEAALPLCVEEIDGSQTASTGFGRRGKVALLVVALLACGCIAGLSNGSRKVQMNAAGLVQEADADPTGDFTNCTNNCTKNGTLCNNKCGMWDVSCNIACATTFTNCGVACGQKQSEEIQDQANKSMAATQKSFSDAQSPATLRTLQEADADPTGDFMKCTHKCSKNGGQCNNKCGTFDASCKFACATTFTNCGVDCGQKQSAEIQDQANKSMAATQKTISDAQDSAKQQVDSAQSTVNGHIKNLTDAATNLHQQVNDQIDSAYNTSSKCSQAYFHCSEKCASDATRNATRNTTRKGSANTSASPDCKDSCGAAHEKCIA